MNTQLHSETQLLADNFLKFTNCERENNISISGFVDNVSDTFIGEESSSDLNL